MSGVNQSAFMNLRSFAPPGPAYELYAWGYNGAGYLGQGDSGFGTQRSSPVQVGSATNWYQVSSTAYGVNAIRADGTLWTWGSGYNGNGGTASYSIPVQVGTLNTWSQVSQNDHKMAIKTNGTLWGWGFNYDGQIGDGSSGNARFTPVQIGTLTTWAKVAAGKNHTVALKTDGTIWAWGGNNVGQLGLGNSGSGTNRSSPVQVGAFNNWAEISAGNKGSIAIKTDGTMWSWGYNGGPYGGYGQLGLGDTTNRSSPTQIGALTTWSKVSMGGFFSCLALKTDGTLWTWGQNSSGQLGVGDTTLRSSPVQIGALTTWSKISQGRVNGGAIKTDGTLWSWGANYFGSVGDGTQTNRSSPVQVGALTTWIVVECSGQFGLGITETE